MAEDNSISAKLRTMHTLIKQVSPDLAADLVTDFVATIADVASALPAGPARNELVMIVGEMEVAIAELGCMHGPTQ